MGGRYRECWSSIQKRKMRKQGGDRGKERGEEGEL